MAVKPFGAGAGSSSAAGLPSQYEYKTNLTNGKLQLWKKAVDGKPAKLVSEQDSKGSWLSTSVTTGVGSFHLGDTISLGSGGEYLATTFKQVGFPTSTDLALLQNISNDGTVIGLPEYIAYGATLDTAESNGVQQATAVDYVAPFTPATSRCFFALSTVAAESYTGELTYQVTYTNGGQELARFDFSVVVVGGGTIVIPFDYPLWALGGEALTTKLFKAETGVPLKVKGGTTAPGEPYRISKSRTWTTHSVLRGSTNYNVTTALTHKDWDTLASCTLAGTSITYTLPDPVSAQGQTISVIKNDAGTATLTIAAFAGKFINGASTYVLRGQYDSVTIMSDGNQYSITAKSSLSGEIKLTVYITSNATFTPDPRAKGMRVRLQGCGGGGSGVYLAHAMGFVHTGGGGSAGMYAEVLFSKAQLPTAPVSVTGLDSTARTGTSAPLGYDAGGTAQFGSYLIVPNGARPAYNSLYGVAFNQIFAGAVANIGYSTSGCSLVMAVPGQDGAAGFAQTGTWVGGGSGGDSLLGKGSLSSNAIASNAGYTNILLPARGYGSGGGGRNGVANGVSGWMGGTDGGFGICIIEEYLA